MSFLNNFYVDWETAGVVLGQTNAIDLPGLNTPTQEKAHEFILSYGYDPDVPAQADELERLRTDALSFIDRHLLEDPDQPGEQLQVPHDVRNERDIRKLMTWASKRQNNLGHWACSLLRVMHTLTHVHNDLAAVFFPAIQKQILDRVLQFTYTDPLGDVFLGRDATGIRLYMLDIKTQKSYDSLALKLLHKEQNTSADIFDRMGFRFVTFTKLEALMALRYLQDNVFAFPNVRTGRSRNTLIDVGNLHYELDRLASRLRGQEMTEEQVFQEAVTIAADTRCHPKVKPEELFLRNHFSSTEYTSIQITCRQLVRVEGPAISPNPQRTTRDGLVEYKFFFPFEIQVLDRESYAESRRGRASHAEYKRSQIRAARERIFPWLAGGESKPQST